MAPAPLHQTRHVPSVIATARNVGSIICATDTLFQMIRKYWLGRSQRVGDKECGDANQADCSLECTGESGHGERG